MIKLHGGKDTSTFSATNFRILLSAGVLIIAIGIAIGYSFGIQQLRGYAVEVSHKKVDAAASNGNIQSLQKLDQQLTGYQDVLKKAESLKITSEFPEFRIVEEVQSVARKNGITISSYSYGSGGDSTATSDTSSSPTGTPAATTTPTASGTISLTVNISSPVNYKKLLQFIYDVEHHIPKMEISGVSISPSTGGSDSVSTEALSIQMYVTK